MDCLDILRSRRSIKDFDPTPVSRETLLTLVDAARYSPSGANKNSWQFIVITEKDTLIRLSTAHPHCKWFASAQAAIAIIIDPASTRYWLEDCCVAAYSIWLAAVSQGLGVAWAAMYQCDSPDESERRQSLVREILVIPGNFNIPIVLGLGYPGKQPPDRKLAVLRDIVQWECYRPEKTVIVKEVRLGSNG